MQTRTRARKLKGSAIPADANTKQEENEDNTLNRSERVGGSKQKRTRARKITGYAHPADTKLKTTEKQG